jgi:3-hydroxybutyryl-CoA dehydrogenase
MDIRQVFVVGAGQMGSGIAQVVAQAGLDVILNDVNEEQLKKGLLVIEKNLLRQVQKNRMTHEEMMTVTSRIHHSMKLTEAKESDMVIEAALEKIQVKQQIFSQLDAIVRNDVVLAIFQSSSCHGFGRSDTRIGNE